MTQLNEPRFGIDDAPLNSRTSVMAVISLVCGLASLVGCCLLGIAPGVGIIGGIFGGLALFRISTSNGRLGGSGLAIGGIITSLLGLALGVIIVVGATQFLNTFEKYGKAVEIAQSSDQSALNNMLTPQAANLATTEGLADFRSKTLADLGKYKRVRPGLLRFFLNMSSVEQAAKALPSTSSGKKEVPIPVPVEFEKGPASMFVQLEQNNPAGANPTTTPFGLVENIGVYDPATGKIFWLIDPSASPAPSTTTPPPNKTPPSPGAAPAQNSPDTPADAPAKQPEPQPVAPK
ncbi:MAG: hypothetical protein GC200_01440 [Tepidisphaera sp.]|nr:hypothetical protein [Tepidisphaera sp.]